MQVQTVDIKPLSRQSFGVQSFWTGSQNLTESRKTMTMMVEWKSMYVEVQPFRARGLSMTERWPLMKVSRIVWDQLVGWSETIEGRW